MHRKCVYFRDLWQTNTGFIRGILRGVRYAKSLRVLFLHRRSPSWTTLVLYSRAVFIFNEPTISIVFVKLIFHHEKVLHKNCTNLSWEPLKVFCNPWCIRFKYLTFRRQRHKLSAPTVLSFVLCTVLSQLYCALLNCVVYSRVVLYTVFNCTLIPPSRLLLSLIITAWADKTASYMTDTLLHTRRQQDYIIILLIVTKISKPPKIETTAAHLCTK